MRRPVDFRAVNLTYRSILSIALMCIEDTVQNATGEKFSKKKAFVRENIFRAYGAAFSLVGRSVYENCRRGANFLDPAGIRDF